MSPKEAGVSLSLGRPATQWTTGNLLAASSMDSDTQVSLAEGPLSQDFRLAEAAKGCFRGPGICLGKVTVGVSKGSL